MPVWSVTTLPDSLNIDAIRRGAVNRRAPLHPLDQFWAFLALREKCESDEELAAAFFVLVNVVKQTMKLTSVFRNDARRLCRGWHDARSTHDLHRVRRLRAPEAHASLKIGFVLLHTTARKARVSPFVLLVPNDRIRCPACRSLNKTI